MIHQWKLIECMHFTTSMHTNAIGKQCSVTLFRIQLIKFNLIYLYYTILLLYGFEESCILIGRGAVRKNPYSDRGP